MPEETMGGDKDYIISILEEMDEEELDAFDKRLDRKSVV